MNPRKEVLGRVNDALREEYPNILLSGRTLNAPSSFPAVSLIMYESLDSETHYDGNGEKYTDLFFEVVVYSNKKTGNTSYAMTECEDLIGIVNGVMSGLNLRRAMQQPNDTVASDGVYRIVARYTGTVDEGHFYRR